MERLYIIYGNGDPKKGSVKLSPITSNQPAAIDQSYAGPIYLSRNILNALGAKDHDQIKVTFEVA
jgi:hypothetical protein